MELYENERIDLYDPVTGTETDETQGRREDSESDELLVRSQKFESLKKNRGWKILEAYFNGVVDQYKEMLIHEQDPAKVVRLQEAIKCYQNVPAFVESHVQEGKEFLERKRTLENQVNPKE